jgi:hypothetical protein
MADDPVLTDEQINKMATEEWYRVLASLWVSIGKPVEKERLMLYADDLKDVPLGLFETAIKNIRKGHEYSNVPTIGTIWKEIEKQLRESNCPDIRTWTEFRDPIIRFGEQDEAAQGIL